MSEKLDYELFDPESKEKVVFVPEKKYSYYDQNEVDPAGVPTTVNNASDTTHFAPSSNPRDSNGQLQVANGIFWSPTGQ